MVPDTHLNHRGFRTDAGFGKDRVLAIGRIAQSRNVKELGCLVDRDLDGIAQATPSWPSNVVITTAYDLEMDLVGILPSRVLLTHLRTTADPKLLPTASLRDSAARQVLRSASVLAESLGILRLLSVRQGLFLSLQSFPLQQASSDAPHETILRIIVPLLLQRSGPRPCTAEGVERAAITLVQGMPGPVRRSLRNGHEYFRAIAHFARALLRGRITSHDELRSVCVSSVTCDQWLTLNIASNLQACFPSAEIWNCALAQSQGRPDNADDIT